MTKKNVEQFLSNLLTKIAETQISKSEEPKIGASGTSVYADHQAVVKIVQNDKQQLKAIFTEKAATQR